MTQTHGHCSPKDEQLLLLIESQITRLMADILLDWLSHKQPAALNDVPVALTATTASWAIYGAALYWSQQKQRENLDDFVDHALPLATAILGQPE